MSNKNYEFFRKIGSPKTVVAPMVDQSDLPYRMQCRQYGAELVFTQMFNANTFVVCEEYRKENFQSCPEDRPLICQLAGHDPQIMLQAAKLLEDHCDAIDINIGCPQGIAKRGRYGAYLMEELDLLREIVSTLSKNLKIPVTCKSRIYKDYDRTIQLYETLVEAGASMLTIHGRTREEKGVNICEADWPTIARIRKHFGDRIPIIGNGGVRNMDDVLRFMEVTGVDGVMTSEGILENPSLFSRNIHPETQLYRNQLDLADEYLELAIQYPLAHMRTARTHLMRMLFRYICRHPYVREDFFACKSIQAMQQVCRKIRDLIGDEEITYTDIWYDRHQSADENVNGRLKHQKYTQEVNLDEMLSAEGGSDGGCDSIFNALGMFNDESY